jgi:signal transduction histidine kinase
LPAIKRITLGLRGFGILAIVLIMTSSYALFFYFQHDAIQQLKSKLFEDQRQRQLGSTQQIAAHIGSDLTLILSFLEGISNSKYLQDKEFYGQEIRQLATEKYNEMNRIVDRLFILDNQDIVVVGIGNSNRSSGTVAPIGNDLSFREWVKEVDETNEPVFSEGFEHVGEYRIIIASPVIDREDNEYLGLVGVSIPTMSFFEHYGNVYDINTQFLVTFDKKGILLAVGADRELVGLPFFGEVVQNFTNHNPTLNRITTDLLGGAEGYGVYDYGNGERLTTYQPIYVADNPTYFLQIVTPTDTIYSGVDPILSEETTKVTPMLLTGSIGATAILIIFLLRWNSSLEKEVKKRTKDLEESNRLLGVTNEQLRERERVEHEFINIAAHEMRTPMQPILGLSEIIREKVLNLAKQLQTEKEEVIYEQLHDSTTIPTRSDSIHKSSSLASSIEKIALMVDVVNRNAKRLERLTDNLLDVSRIENNKSLQLSKEIFSIDSVIQDCIMDVSQHTGKKNLEFSYVAAEDDNNQQPMVNADKNRIMQVVMNLLDNAIKFSEDGIISVTTTIDPDSKNITVSVRDSGNGIDTDIVPRLFSKFATSSERGTGLGLFISKKIVEAHGGKIWAENNKDGKGATFGFTLP